MKVSKLIQKLQELLKKDGDLDVYVDTEAGKFPCHMVDVEDAWSTTELEDGEPLIFLSLDSEIMCYVHPSKES